MDKTQIDIEKAGLLDWALFGMRVSTRLERFCHEIGYIPLPVIDTCQKLDTMKIGFYQFEPFLKWSELPLAYEKTRTMLQKYIAEHKESAAIRLPEAAKHFPVIRVCGLSEQEKRAGQESEILRFFGEQTQIEQILGQY